MPDDSPPSAPPLSTWPAQLTRPTLSAWREAGGRGVGLTERLQLAVQAYIAAGGEQAGVEATVRAMLEAGAREHRDWLFGPEQARIERHSPYRGDADYPVPGWPERLPGDSPGYP